MSDDTYLSERQREAWQLVKRGDLSYDAAADEMGITRNTLERHLEEAYKKRKQAKITLTWMADAFLDWAFEVGDVIVRDENEWWHVTKRLRDEESQERMYKLWDATHTKQEYYYAEEAEHVFESAGWSLPIGTKPASERGYRVNGFLCGPSDVEKRCSWPHGRRNRYRCPECGNASSVNVIQVLETGETQCSCNERGCGFEALAEEFESLNNS